jgi:hypothetical protein
MKLYSFDRMDAQRGGVYKEATIPAWSMQGRHELAQPGGAAMKLPGILAMLQQQ